MTGRRNYSLMLGMAFLAACIIVATDFARACSRILWNTNKQAVVVARTVDWVEPLGERLVIYPRGLRLEGGAGTNSHNWVSNYGSLRVVLYEFGLKALQGTGVTEQDFLLGGDGDIEGINEKGLAAHLLYLPGTEYEKRDARPGVILPRWLHYVLDNFATVEEAVAGMRAVQIVPVEIGGIVHPLHLAIDDATGDSAIIEFISGKMVVHHGNEHTVMTNDPPYPSQLANLKKYKAFGGTIGELPGGVGPADRFVRAAALLKTLPEPNDISETVASLFSVIRNVSVPFGASSGAEPAGKSFPTWWMAVSDLDGRVFYFHWTNLNLIDFSAEKPISMLDPRDISLVGDVTDKFVPVPMGKPSSTDRSGAESPQVIPAPSLQ